MKLIRDFKITSDEFYDYLEEKLLQDIQQTTGKKVKAKEIKKGFRYDKKDAYTTITINDYKRHEIYSATVKSRTDFITITYQTKETKEGLQITFEEYVDSYDSVRDKKNIVSRTFHDWISFGRMSNTLYGIRNDIVNKKEGISPVNQKQMESFKGLRKTLEKKLNEKGQED